MSIQLGSVVSENGQFVFKNDEDGVVQRLSTAALGSHLDPRNEIRLEPFRDDRLQVEGEWQHDWLVNVSSLKIVQTPPRAQMNEEHRGRENALYDPRIRSFVPTRDARAEMPGEKAPAPTKQEIDVFKRHRTTRSERRLNLELTAPPPGGFGAGVSFKDGQLLFKNDTRVHFYLLAPQALGGIHKADLLYMTSSNRAGRGCEALLSFFKEENFNAVFRIWDWAHPDVPGGGKFIKGLAYSELTEYLIPYEVQTGSQLLRFMTLYIVNSTRRVAGDNWTNEVYLHNRQSGTHDLIWKYDFSWPTQPTDGTFFWGPIFEVFPNDADYSGSNLIGFDQTLLVQDGYEEQLIDQNSALIPPPDNGLTVMYRTRDTNSGLICGNP
jgi:hypothetical protein